MTLAGKLGGSYEQAKDRVKLRKIKIVTDAAEFELKVRIPFKKEMEAILTKIATPSQDQIDAIYERYTQDLKKSISEGGDAFISALNAEKQVLTVLENDIVLEGNSMRQLSTLTAMYETKVEEFFHLLQSETGEPINETFEQISEEFPEPIIKIIVDEIEKATKPDYKSTKKN